ncbi:hypothetical protein CH63R_14638 [Colletotrichum higginsianum IMI 349063]|uniref:Uncharacterized protein n=1 Tax=Colletotrichum higginsianum (strain IMI 349063) TaxID=759273 RepID=A0A1B7XQL9_COLHI|nr:hypothetical protein CH63R_14638 [Colletotrichum higginsianum IMI 349063]OBR02066.1 hypothetical protein CH63R_14638 [Colletotrichum higginsianum IMI 349063]
MASFRRSSLRLFSLFVRLPFYPGRRPLPEFVHPAFIKFHSTSPAHRNQRTESRRISSPLFDGFMEPVCPGGVDPLVCTLPNTCLFLSHACPSLFLKLDSPLQLNETRPKLPVDQRIINVQDRQSYVFRSRTLGELTSMNKTSRSQVTWRHTDVALMKAFLVELELDRHTIRSADLRVLARHMDIDVDSLDRDHLQGIYAKMRSSMDYMLKCRIAAGDLAVVFDPRTERNKTRWTPRIRRSWMDGVVMRPRPQDEIGSRVGPGHVKATAALAVDTGAPVSSAPLSPQCTAPPSTPSNNDKSLEAPLDIRLRIPGPQSATDRRARRMMETAETPQDASAPTRPLLSGRQQGGVLPNCPARLDGGRRAFAFEHLTSFSQQLSEVVEASVALAEECDRLQALASSKAGADLAPGLRGYCCAVVVQGLAGVPATGAPLGSAKLQLPPRRYRDGSECRGSRAEAR